MRFTTHIFGGLEVHDRALWLAYVSSVGRHGLQGEHARLARRKVVPRGKRCHQAFARQAGRGNDDEVWMRQQTVSKNGAVIHGTLYTKIMHGSLITQVCTIFHVPGPAVFRNFFFFFKSSLLTSSSTRRRFYPQRSSGQAVVTGVVPSPPRYMPPFLSRIGFSIPTAGRFSSNVAINNSSRSRAFRQSIIQEKVYTSTLWARQQQSPTSSEPQIIICCSGLGHFLISRFFSTEGIETCFYHFDFS